jgi:capsular polysaccharide biosynthesis protein
MFQKTWVRELEEGMVFGPTVGVVSSDNFLIPDVSIEWSCPPEAHWTFRKLKLPTPTPLSGHSLILASTGGDSYFHWMTDVLPRVRLVKEAGYKMNSFDYFIINKLEAGYQRETLKYLKIPSKKIREIGTKPSGYLCEHAVLPSLPSFPGAVPPETIQYLRSIVPQTIIQKGAKLYIDRGKSKRRKIPEEGQITDWLKTQGFEIIDCGQISVKDQAAAFAHAELIVAPHGGALTNLMFCREGTKVVELLSSKYPNPCYRNLCGVSGLPYTGIIGNSQKSKTTSDLSDSSGPIENTLEDIKTALEQMSLC